MRQILCNVRFSSTEERTSLILGGNVFVHMPGVFRGTYLHMHFTSDRMFREGSYVLLPSNEVQLMCRDSMIDYLESESDATKKIEATTDSELVHWDGISIPKISQSFLDMYVKSNEPIIKVFLELEENQCDGCKKGLFMDPATGLHTYSSAFMDKIICTAHRYNNPKVDSNNCVIINPFIESYSHEYVQTLRDTLTTCHKALCTYGSHPIIDSQVIKALKDEN